MTKILVICGGVSDEREVSLRSGAAVARALKLVGYDVNICDTTDSDEKFIGYDVAFPVLHGVGGEDGQIQSRLERRNVAYVGSDSVSSKLCMNKSVYRQKMIEAGFTMAKGGAVTYEQYKLSEIRKKPHVIKPINGGSSFDTFIIRNTKNVDELAIKRAFERHTTLLLEELIIGTEVTVGILGDEVLPVIEIIPPENEEFDYENKYNGKTRELLPPIHVSKATQAKVQAIALDVHRVAGCRDMSRIDFIITKKNVPYLLETNTIPGMTDQSLFPKMAASMGVDMPTLCHQLISFALVRAAISS